MIRSRVAQLVACLVLLTGTIGLTACGTVEGMGRDIQAGGHAISNAARDVRDSI
ncbi:entericidin A/B family lipoprotein [Roseospira marina]|uniref:Entericidin A/B family lipoprotein n=1 Tax=Roseospira marina TaxID=140057 RepID=A0A5M6I8C5_9PROT|nr:entericidin A/B family lipoprotein [Roseospira marina]KAA5604514.1 entericidin A/B family lipoprotein [Roseospira marina]MBB4315571.1 putative small secreted protein [Roseospira marina]MBB5088492.1 putative small secreted protein [Roseospira marina]